MKGRYQNGEIAESRQEDSGDAGTPLHPVRSPMDAPERCPCTEDDTSGRTEMHCHGSVDLGGAVGKRESEFVRETSQPERSVFVEARW